MMKVLLFLIWFALCWHSVYADDVGPDDDLDDLLIIAVNEGARVMNDRLQRLMESAAPGKEIVFDKISAGNSLWIAFFPLMKLGSDAGLSFGLNMTIPHTLAPNLEATIKALYTIHQYLNWFYQAKYNKDYFSSGPYGSYAKEVCGRIKYIWYVEDNMDRINEAASLALKALNKRVEALSSITFSKPWLIKTKQDCLEPINSSQRWWTENLEKYGTNP